jgi:molecular chaperone GrpE
MNDEAKQADNTQNPKTNDVEEMTSSTKADEMDLQGLESDATVAQEQSSSSEAQTEPQIGQTEELESSVVGLAAEVETLKAKLEERTNQYMRIAADFENFRKRTQKEKEDLETQVKCTTITEILPVVDNFERARSQLKPQTDAEMTIHKSYQSVYKQLVESLKRLGVAPMRPKGKEFDPNLHDAVMREPTNEYPEGVVMEELMPGYFLGERVLRHAMVKVAAASEGMVTSEESQPE